MRTLSRLLFVMLGLAGTAFAQSPPEMKQPDGRKTIEGYATRGACCASATGAGKPRAYPSIAVENVIGHEPRPLAGAARVGIRSGSLAQADRPGPLISPHPGSKILLPSFDVPPCRPPLPVSNCRHA